MSMTRRLLLVLVCATGSLAFAAQAADLAKRKSGLWEIKTSTSGAPSMTMQMCVDQNQDDITQGSDDREMRKQCPKVDSKKVGDTIVVDSVCKFEGTTMTGHTVISGNLATDYRMESTTRFDPPMHGMAGSKSTMTGRWLGPCKPGQKHGTVVMSGMPGGGQFKLDPEMLKQMEKMQQQYGR
ncbi:MAG: DUF3617 family protein [Thiobacillus sp.]|nr:DUF3617 family protein [Thiobacillus sp.]